MRLKLCALILSVAAFLQVVVQPASAGTIPGITSLADLINKGPLLTNGVQIGNDVFYNFGYSGSPTPDTPGAPNPSSILVTSTDTATGLRFAFPWSSTQGNSQASNITYSVHVADTVPQQFINSAILDFQSSVAAASAVDNATTTQTFSNTTNLVAFAQQTVLNTGTSPAQPISNNMALAPTRDFAVMNGIVVHSGASSTGNASVTFVDNIYNQAAVPEPAFLALAGAAGLTLLVRRRLL